MTLMINTKVAIQSLTTSAYGSSTNNATFRWRDAKNYAGQMRLGTVTGTGQVDWLIQDSADDPDVVTSPNYRTLLTGASLTTTSQVSAVFESVSIRPIMPFGRLQTIAKSGAAGTFTVENLVGHILAELV